MQCTDAREFVSAFVDGELAGELQQRAGAHIATCSACSKLADDYRDIGRHIASGYEPPASDLADKIRKSIDSESAATASVQQRGLHSLLRQAAVFILACGLSALAGWYLTQQAVTRNRLERDIVASHVRSLLQDKPVQIASSERHVVKPWFAGKVDFSPTMKDLSAQGFPLVGARIDYVEDRRVAALVYMRRLHVINVFIWPNSGGSSEPQAVAFKGYNGVTWTAEGMTYWAISDLNALELKELQALVR